MGDIISRATAAWGSNAVLRAKDVESGIAMPQNSSTPVRIHTDRQKSEKEA
jgi:hypothetical protein